MLQPLIIWKSFLCGWFLLSGETHYLISISGITWTKGEGMSEIIASCVTTVHKNVKYYLEARRLENCLFVILLKLLSFQEEPPLPNGKTSLEQHHSHLLMNVFPSRQTCLPGTYKKTTSFTVLLSSACPFFPCMNFVCKCFLWTISVNGGRNTDVLFVLWIRWPGILEALSLLAQTEDVWEL